MTEAPEADLHLHTTTSDGTCTVADRVRQATERDLDAIAITDHDRIPQELTSRHERRGQCTAITGTEVRADYEGVKVEILGYFLDPDVETLVDTLATARRYRRERNRRLVERLTDETGLDLSYDRLAESVEGSLGRPHLADRLVEEGVVDDIGTAFDRYLGSDGSAYVPMERVPYGTVIDAIHEADGIASLAHPGRIRSDRVPEIVADLASAGLDAIEVQYPYGGSGPDAYADVDAEAAASLAATHDLLETGGSDCHGPGSGKFRIGEVGVDAQALAALRAAAGVA